jgi:hypothetical protein
MYSYTYNTVQRVYGSAQYVADFFAKIFYSRTVCTVQYISVGRLYIAVFGCHSRRSVLQTYSSATIFVQFRKSGTFEGPQ